MKKLAIIIALAALTAPSFAQKYPERRMIRGGNTQYERGNYVEAEVAYRRALEKAPASYEAADNLAKSLYKQERWEEAAKIFAPLAADTLHRQHAAAAYYDTGNALFQQRKLQEALEAYKQSLRINPGDMEAKFNLAYTQKLLENNQGGGGDDNKDNQDNQDQQNPQDQPQPQQGGQDKKEGDQQEKPQQGQAQEAKISQQEAEQMLQAIQAAEDKTREKVDEKQAQQAKPKGGKNW